jgi:hypothetical protein
MLTLVGRSRAILDLSPIQRECYEVLRPMVPEKARVSLFGFCASLPANEAESIIKQFAVERREAERRREERENQDRRRSH